LLQHSKPSSSSTNNSDNGNEEVNGCATSSTGDDKKDVNNDADDTAVGEEKHVDSPLNWLADVALSKTETETTPTTTATTARTTTEEVSSSPLLFPLSCFQAYYAGAPPPHSTQESSCAQESPDKCHSSTDPRNDDGGRNKFSGVVNSQQLPTSYNKHPFSLLALSTSLRPSSQTSIFNIMHCFFVLIT
jgi:hypothetical protein